MHHFLLVVAMIGLVSAQDPVWPCQYQPNQWMSPLNLQGPRYEPTFKPLHVFSFLQGGEGLVMENTGSTVRIQYPIRYGIHSVPANLTDIQISKGPLADTYTASHTEFRWGPAVLPVHPAESSSTGGSELLSSSSSPTNSSGGLFLDLASMVRAAPKEYGSDHGISGHYYPLEMQIFFYNTKHASFAEAVAATPQGITDHRDINEDVVALSVLFEVGEQNEELTKLTDRLELIAQPGSETNIVAKMCFERILTRGRDFITYPGSLTQTPCTHGVRWIVLVETLTLSQAQLDQFRLLTLNATDEWTPPLDHPLGGRLVQTNLKQLPLDDQHFIPDWHPHGPPVTTIDPNDPLNGGPGNVVINPFAKDAEDAAYKNYWSPFDYTIQDDAEPSQLSSTAPAAETSTADESVASSAPSVSGPDGGEASSAGGGGGASSPGGLLEANNQQGGSSSSGTDEEPPVEESSSAAVIPGEGEETGGNVPVDATSSSSSIDMNEEKKVKIPYIYHLGSTAYFTPDFKPHKHDFSEDGHYHPPSLGDSPSDDSMWLPDDQPAFKKSKQLRSGAQQQAMNPSERRTAKSASSKATDKKADEHPRVAFRRHWK